MPSLTDCYQACADITDSSNHPYGRALSLFPKHVRPHIQALYAFAHITEHIHQLPPAQAVKHTESLRAHIGAGRTDAHSRLPHLTALAHTMQHFDLNTDALHRFLDHSVKGARQKKFEQYRALQSHIDQTSGALSQLASEMLIGRRQKSLFASGLAFARAHHLLHVLGHARHHLPQNDLKKFGYKAKHLKDGVVNEQWQPLCEHYLKKIEAQLRKAEQEHAQYPPAARLALQAAQSRMSTLTAKIRENEYDIFSKPPKLSWLEESRLLWPMKVKAQLADLRS